MAGAPPEKIHLVDAVYGIVRDVPLNYVTRGGVDQRLVDNLTRDKHIVVYGSSKQGKTCLRKHCLQEDDYIVVQCANRWSLQDIHENVLKRAGFHLTQSEKKTVSGKNKVNATAGGKLFGFGVTAGAEHEGGTQTETTRASLDLDLSDVNDVISALRGIDFKRYIVLEDFHYLPIDTQKDFAVALKAFHETSPFCFIIIGVWLDENRLIVYNGDLAGRLVAVDADKWKAEELDAVITVGATLLNIQFTDKFKKDLLAESFESVYIVQEACRQACIRASVTRTQDAFRVIGGDVDVNRLVKEVVDQQSGRYSAFITNFSGGFQETRLEMYKWLLYPVLTSNQQKLEEGFRWNELRKVLQEHHPAGENFNPGNLSQALVSTTSLQVAKDIKPIILDYDQTNRRLNVVDRGFIIWLAHQNRADLLEMLEINASDAPRPVQPTLPNL